mmetsp:Transcript_4364/g.12299  ORF Transcript_4364/g.12299 Transcript_4364/m.12299 type:complete len:241 (-) Transcript_4364:970-1692(-)
MKPSSMSETRDSAWPSSARILRPSISACSTVASSVAMCIAREILSIVRAGSASLKPTPTLRPWTTSALWNWSAQIGVTTDGLPARRADCVVPTPPWCTTQQHRGKSHACGACGTKHTSFAAKAASLPRSLMRAGGWPSWGTSALPSSPAQPPITTPRLPTCISARSAISSMSWGGNSSASMEPQPTATGAGPCSRNCFSSWSEPPGERSPAVGISLSTQAPDRIIALKGRAFWSMVSLTV